ncbi:MAG TPA: L,D-transpeptidase [Burkholderiales bacterium]|nr:L,D-transpeptidase [Burkholderiales bacterium]
MKIRIGIASQTLSLLDDGGGLARIYPVSSSKYGPGEKSGSFRTPRGLHVIRAKIGKGMPINTVFVGRRPTGEIYSNALSGQFPDRDWILTRILWLCGREPGFNRFGDVDTMRRYIYIHGSPDTAEMGKPGSIGCIRMRNEDLVDLFERVKAGTEVDISESS